MNETILIVEDEEKLAQVLTEYLHQSGYKFHCITNGLEVVPWVKEQKPDLMFH